VVLVEFNSLLQNLRAWAIAGRKEGPIRILVTDYVHRAGTFKQAVGSAKEETERELILNALRKTQWNRVHAAKILGIDYKTLRRKIQQYALFPGREDMP